MTPAFLFSNLAQKVLSSLDARAGGGSALATIPLSLLTATAGNAFSLLINHLIAQQRSAGERLSKEAGKVVAFEVAPIRLSFRISDQGYFVVSRSQGGVASPVDTEIKMQWADLAGALSSPASVSRKAQISGDLDFAQAVSTAILDLHWDPESDLSRIVGDAQAVWIMNALSGAGVTVKDLLVRFKHNLREYSVFEKGLTPSADEFARFKSDISALRDDLARLDKRVQKQQGVKAAEGRTDS